MCTLSDCLKHLNTSVDILSDTVAALEPVELAAEALPIKCNSSY